MRVRIESILPCSADAAWQEVQTSRLLHEVASPWVSLKPAPGDEIPDRWQAGRTIRLRPLLFRFVPIGTRNLLFERIDPAARQIQTKEFDPRVSRWDHLIHVEPVGRTQCRYRDDVEVQAGLLTPLVWLFARGFYSHRQRRWRKVAARLAARAA